MKKMLVLFMSAFAALFASADTITNYVVVVSNIYNRISEERVITNKVKNTHTNYYYTNNVYTVEHQTLVVTKTNVTQNLDVSQQAIEAAQQQANRAAEAVTNAQDFASSAAGSASSAASSASSAASAASQAAAQRSSAASECSSALQTINNRIAWFDQHSGETITQVNITSNIYINVNAQGYSFTYTNAAGVAYNYVTVHPYGQNGGVTVSARSSSAYSTLAIRAWPRPRVSGWWDFYPAYVDYDEKGMRLQYVPDTTIPIKYSGGEGVYPNGWIVPEYFYWQSGYIYMKVRVWENGSVVAWCITRYSWANWPNTIGYGGDNGTYMELVDRQGYGSSSMLTSQLAAFYSKTRTASAGQSIEFPMQASSSYASTLQWMREGPKFTDLESKVDALSAQWTQVSSDWSNTRTALAGAMTAMSNRMDAADGTISAFGDRLTNVENGNPHVYVDPGGTRYENIIVYDRAQANGKVAVTTVGNYYPSLEYRFYPAYGGSDSANYWTYSPGYVDSDSGGMRIHYVVNERRTITAATYNAGYLYVPRDFYWQAGTIYIVIDSFNGSTFSGRITLKYAGTGQYAYPASIYGTSSDAQTQSYVSTPFHSRVGTIMGTQTSATFGHLKTAYNKYMSNYNDTLWIPESPSVEQQATIDWLATFAR